MIKAYHQLIQTLKYTQDHHILDVERSEGCRVIKKEEAEEENKERSYKLEI